MRIGTALAACALAACAHRAPPAAPVAAPPKSESVEAVMTPKPAPLEEKPQGPKVVLHVGDSTVGGRGGLARALAARFEPEGARYVRDAWTGVQIATFDRSNKLEKLIAENDPDLVLITLGANDITIPYPWALDKHVQSIAKKTEGRTCFWIGPPAWRKDTGIVEVIRKNSAPCTFFDSSHLRIKRRPDGIHPSDEGGEQWAQSFWTFYRGADRDAVSLHGPLDERRRP